MAIEDPDLRGRETAMSSDIVFRGYTKKEGDHWVAICIDLNIVAQGSTPQEATKECYSLILAYLDYIRTEYPEDFHNSISRPAPQEFINEFNSIMGAKISTRKQLRNRDIHNFDIKPAVLAHSQA
jgi:predicted RNase H-like HicB family nuclease